MKRILIASVLSLVVVAVAATPAGAAGKSANAKLCQKDGWKTVFRSDRSTFANQGDCVSYTARGGRIYPLASLELTQPCPQPADGICVRAVGTGLEPGSALVITAVNVDEFVGKTEIQSSDTVPPSGSIDVIRNFFFRCIGGNTVTTATATATSADSLSTPVVPGITITSNTVTHSASGCP